MARTTQQRIATLTSLVAKCNEAIARTRDQSASEQSQSRRTVLLRILPMLVEDRDIHQYALESLCADEVAA